jgi:hypothetical protein
MMLTRGRVVRAILLVISLPIDDTVALECRTAPSKDSYWQWRQVDGRRCWFPGSGNLKTDLHWDAKPIRYRRPDVASAAGDGGSRRTTPPLSPCRHR